jgi:hypothetical protein
MPEGKAQSIIIDSSSIIALYKLNLIDVLKDLYASNGCGGMGDEANY